MFLNLMPNKSIVFKNSLVSQAYEWYCIYIKYVYYYILCFHLFQ